MAINSNWPLPQLDIKKAFLNGDLEEKVFMSLLLGFEDRLDKIKVCKLKKSLNGLKQSLKAWFECIKKAVSGYDYCQSQENHTMFYKQSRKGKSAI